MINRSTLGGTLLCIALLVGGCGSPSSSTDKPPAEPTSPAPGPAQTVATEPAAEALVAEAPEATTAPVETPAPGPEAEAASAAPPLGAAPAATTPRAAPAEAPIAAPATSPVSSLAAATTPTKTPSAPAPATEAATTSALADPGGAVAVAVTKPGLERVGAEACGDCHDLQFESWADSAHAGRIPPLDCEDCHGPGSEYQPKAVMKDSVRARAAGLVMPDQAFCGTCHKKGVDDAFMAKAHAHEE